MAQPWHDPRVPADVDCVLRPLLERRAAETPDKTFALFADGTAWTYREAGEAARRAAVGFRRLGVEQGDTVLSWLPNGPDALRVWFGLNYLGAVYVPINLAYRGGILEHVVDNADARLLVVHAQLLPRLEPIGRARLADAVVVGGTVDAIDGLRLHDETALAPTGADLPPLAREIAPWDTQSIIYTSGTTGPSKGVMSSYLQLYSMGVVRIVDEHDCEVALGAVGELIVRTDRPWAMNHGYFRNPEATARAWRNGWFHTGDAFRVDAAGNYFFVDRIKDAIRRRGENISSFEVETEVGAHPAVKEAAVVAVASNDSEDEVLVAVSLADGAQLDPEDLIRFLLPRMAHFMVPRYVRVVDELPKTPTQKVQKHVLRTEGVTADTWDRAATGIEVKRERIGVTTAPGEERRAR